MNLLRKRVEMPRAIWEASSLTTGEKILLSVVCSPNVEEWTPITLEDVVETLDVTKSIAVNLIQALSAREALEVVHSAAGRLQLRLGPRLSEAVVHERLTRRKKLTLCFIECLCGYDLRMEFTDQIRICPECRRLVYCTPGDKLHLARGDN